MSNASIRYILKRKALVDNAKSKPCTDCGNTYPLVCMDLHHVDPSTKLFSLSQWHTKGITAIEEEIHKCIVLCANCHRIRTYSTGE